MKIITQEEMVVIGKAETVMEVVETVDRGEAKEMEEIEGS
jgi:hypothetical protein